MDKQLFRELVESVEEGGRILCGKCKPNRAKRLDDLLATVTPENIHPEIKTGKARGNEIW